MDLVQWLLLSCLGAISHPDKWSCGWGNAACSFPVLRAQRFVLALHCLRLELYLSNSHCMSGDLPEGLNNCPSGRIRYLQGAAGCNLGLSGFQNLLSSSLPEHWFRNVISTAEIMVHLASKESNWTFLFYLFNYLFILHPTHSFPSFSFQSLPPTPSYPLFLWFSSDTGDPPMDISQPCFIKLQWG